MSARIMLVEDDPLVRLVLADILDDAGFTVIEAGSGDAAATALDRMEAPDVLVTDIQMPGHLDGIGLARHARALHPGLPVIYVTGRPDLFGGARLFGTNTTMIGKPYRPEQILNAVRRILDEGDDAQPRGLGAAESARSGLRQR